MFQFFSPNTLLRNHMKGKISPFYVKRLKKRYHLFSATLALRCLTDLFVLFVEEGYVKMFLRGRPVTMYMPKEQVDSYSLQAKVELPAKRLKLEWVYPLSTDCTCCEV